MSMRAERARRANEEPRLAAGWSWLAKRMTSSPHRPWCSSLHSVLRRLVFRGFVVGAVLVLAGLLLFCRLRRRGHFFLAPCPGHALCPSRPFLRRLVLRRLPSRPCLRGSSPSASSWRSGRLLILRRRFLSSLAGSDLGAAIDAAGAVVAAFAGSVFAGGAGATDGGSRGLRREAAAAAGAAALAGAAAPVLVAPLTDISPSSLPNSPSLIPLTFMMSSGPERTVRLAIVEDRLRLDGPIPGNASSLPWSRCRGR